MSQSAIDNNDAAQLQAVIEGIGICDRQKWGRIEVSDDDRIRFLHNQSTNDLQALKPGEGCDTVFVTSTARTVDLATAYVQEDRVILLVSPNRREFLMQWLDKYIFFADKVKLTDISEDTATLSILGVKSDAIVESLGLEEIIGKADGNHISIPSVPGGMIAVGSGLAIPGYTLIIPVTNKHQIWEEIIKAGAIALNEKTWETLRILQGRPAPDKELTEDYNPLEVGLWQTVSFDKGCYIGQETIARLNTYKGVKQYLWGIRLQAPVEPGTIITMDSEKIGQLTSYTQTPTGHFGLGYIRTKAGGIGLKVTVGEVQGEVVEIPFVSHEYP
ncbi:MAG: YgfZ/GcvT domain-containing protein [Mastigocoleus sp.]